MGSKICDEEKKREKIPTQCVKTSNYTLLFHNLFYGEIGQSIPTIFFCWKQIHKFFIPGLDKIYSLCLLILKKSGPIPATQKYVFVCKGLP